MADLDETWEERGDEQLKKEQKGSGEEEEEENSYKLLMSDRNKETLLRIQLQQLSRDHPHHVDFYNTTLKAQEALKKKDMDEMHSLMRRLYPLYRFGDGQDDDSYQVSTVVPGLSQALGSLKITRANRPRFALDLDAQESLKHSQEMDDPLLLPVQGEIAPRKALMLIEKLFEYLLLHDEAVTRTEYLNYRSNYDEEVKQESLKKATSLLKDRSVMKAMMSIDKGRVAITRLLSVLDPTKGTEILAEAIHELAEFSSIDTSRNEEVFRGIRSCLTRAKRSDLDVLLGHLNEACIADLGSSEIGITYILELLSCYKKIVIKFGDDAASLWLQLVNLVTETFGSLDSLTLPIKIPKGFRKQMREDIYVVNEYKHFWDALLDTFCKEGVGE